MLFFSFLSNFISFCFPITIARRSYLRVCRTSTNCRMWKHTLSLFHTHTHTHTHLHSDTPLHTFSLSHTRTFTHSLTHIYVHRAALTFKFTHTHTPSNTHTHTLTHFTHTWQAIETLASAYVHHEMPAKERTTFSYSPS